MTNDHEDRRSLTYKSGDDPLLPSGKTVGEGHNADSVLEDYEEVSIDEFGAPCVVSLPCSTPSQVLLQEDEVDKVRVMNADPLPITAGDRQGSGVLKETDDGGSESDDAGSESDDGGSGGDADAVGADQVNAAFWPASYTWVLVGAAAAAATALWWCSSGASRSRKD